MGKGRTDGKWHEFVSFIKNDTGAESLKAAMDIASERKSEWTGAKNEQKNEQKDEQKNEQKNQQKNEPVGKSKKTSTRHNKSGKRKM